MKDVDGLIRHIDIFIHCYLTQAGRIRLSNITLRPFAYSFNSFNSCSNPRRVTASDITVTTEISLTFPPLTIINHAPIHFTSTFILPPYSVPKPIPHTFHHIDLILLSFNSITTVSVHSFLFGRKELLLTSSSNKPA